MAECSLQLTDLTIIFDYARKDQAATYGVCPNRKLSSTDPLRLTPTHWCRKPEKLSSLCCYPNVWLCIGASPKRIRNLDT
jgi:hypothetical protein